MITLEELKQAKNIRKTTLYYAEKEYLQYIFLNAISKYAGSFAFKGGTCLRICYGLERASEDLDFSTHLKEGEIKKMVYKCLKDFEYVGVKHEVYSEKEFRGNLRMEIRFEGPLFNGSKNSTNALKIDFNTQPVKHKKAKVVPKLFSDVPAFTIMVLDEAELLAEKIRALVKRSESRDLYDVWMLLGKGVQIDAPLLFDKLKEENAVLSGLKFPPKDRYELELKNLVTVLPPYEQVKQEVGSALKKIKP